MLLDICRRGTLLPGGKSEIRAMIATVIGGMYVSLYATLLGIAANLWLKINLRLLGNRHG
jgi:hypothetical protein